MSDTPKEVFTVAAPAPIPEKLAQLHREMRFMQICNDMRRLYARKNADYGNCFAKSYQDYGLLSTVIRLGDKYNRLKALACRQAQVKDESVRDTLVDLANYAIMTIIEMDMAADSAEIGSAAEKNTAGEG